MASRPSIQKQFSVAASAGTPCAADNDFVMHPDTILTESIQKQFGREQAVATADASLVGANC